MYMVVSKWQALPGKEAEFEQSGPKAREALKSQPGVEFVEAIKADGHYTVVHAYADEAAYHRIVDSPDSAFSQALKANNVESLAQWVGSERGETL